MELAGRPYAIVLPLAGGSITAFFALIHMR
jgi:hypothetical protein